MLVHRISLGVALFGLWLVLSGHFEPLLLGLGLASTILVLVIVHRMEVVDHEGHPVHLTWRAVIYTPWLIWEIIKANIDVARVILHPRLPISPCLIRVTAGQKTELGQVIYADSITLTPGTVTVDMAAGELQVHALTRAAAEGLETGDMDRRVCAMEGAA